MIKIDRKQQAALQHFFKEETTWCPEHVAANMLMCILSGISMILLIMPTYVMDERGDIYYIVVLPIILYNWGMASYASKFTVVEKERIYDLFRYLPVSKTQFGLFKARKVGRICLPLFGIALVLRIVISVAVYHGISGFDFLIPIVGMFLLPLLMCML
jgi:hypothetical protein